MTTTIKLTPLLRSYLKPFDKIKRPPLTVDDWDDFKIRYGSDCHRLHRHRRKFIKKTTGKWPEEFSFDEFLDYQKPNSSAPNYLKELWPQLTPEEQELVKNFHEWAFMFPASFDTHRQYQCACSFRLERLFGRKFHLKKAKTKKIAQEDEKFGKLAEGAIFEN